MYDDLLGNYSVFCHNLQIVTSTSKCTHIKVHNRCSKVGCVNNLTQCSNNTHLFITLTRRLSNPYVGF